MMPKESTFAIMLFGLTESERRVVKSLCMLSGSRPRSYQVLSTMDAHQADVWIVDGRDADALESYQTLRAERAVPAILVDAGLEANECEARLGRPIVASRLLNALDQLVGNAIGQVTAAVSRPTPASPPARASAQSAPRPRRHTALVVDDSLTIRKQVEMALHMHDIEAACAESAEEAMELLATRHFDVIFLDVVLPGDTDGYQICRSIKKNSVHKGTPVIMLTSKSSPFDRVRGSLAGCDTYLTKPVESKTFSAVLRKHLKAHGTALAV